MLLKKPLLHIKRQSWNQIQNQNSIRHYLKIGHQLHTKSTVPNVSRSRYTTLIVIVIVIVMCTALYTSY